jgi:uncharacterized membrane protein (DUF2068 family)
MTVLDTIQRLAVSTVLLLGAAGAEELKMVNGSFTATTTLMDQSCLRHEGWKVDTMLAYRGHNRDHGVFLARLSRLKTPP